MQTSFRFWGRCQAMKNVENEFSIKGAKSVAKKLTLVGEPTVCEPASTPKSLGPHGAALWTQVTDEYVIDDIAGRTLLLQICETADRVERMRQQIDRDGELVRASKSGGRKEHPLIKAELAGRSFIARSLQRLGLNLEPARASRGRPTLWSQND